MIYFDDLFVYINDNFHKKIKILNKFVKYKKKIFFNLSKKVFKLVQGESEHYHKKMQKIVSSITKVHSKKVL